MQIIRTIVPETYDLFLFGDNQHGNCLSYVKGFKAVIDEILHSTATSVHMGDLVEGIWWGDKRYNPNIHKQDVLQAQEEVEQLIAPLAKHNRLAALLQGNHEDHLLHTAGDITRSICRRLGIPFGGRGCVIEFYDHKGIQFKGYFTHGFRSIRSIADDPERRDANERLQLKQHLKNKYGDTLLNAKGHTHRLIIAEPKPRLYMTTDGQAAEGSRINQHYTHNPAFHASGYIHPDHRWYVNTGSFLRNSGEGVESYAEKFEYDPIELGYAKVRVVKREIVAIDKVVL